ncbi:MAG: hypothetical protein HC831_31275 [Chloroflexia bacterium]|nr:hypothetical protein [Chloroflexia bacterium]
MDVHRLVMLLGYRFSDRVQFISEIEYEHVKEVYIEQAFLQVKINDFMNFRGGLMLTPMGIINEYHEPTTFNGVERPVIDSKIAPTTWREVGVGLQGNILPATLKYQFYVTNGFNGFDGAARLNGQNGLRSGRQKGAESFISSPNFAGKIEYYGIKGLNIGFSGYFGKTQSTLYDGIDKDDDAAMATADSSVVGVAMIGIDARYNIGGLQLRGQYYLTNLSNTNEYNEFTADANGLNDLGSAMSGYYIEAGYNLFKSTNAKSELIPFVRYEEYNTHSSVENTISENASYNVNMITTGITWKLTPKAALKADLQFIKNEAADQYAKQFNAGVAVMF